MVGYCYIIRDFSSLLARDINITAINQADDLEVCWYACACACDCEHSRVQQKESKLCCISESGVK